MNRNHKINCNSFCHLMNNTNEYHKQLNLHHNGFILLNGYTPEIEDFCNLKLLKNFQITEKKIAFFHMLKCLPFHLVFNKLNKHVNVGISRCNSSYS